MIVKILTETLSEKPAWAYIDLDKHAIQAYWNIPLVIEEGVKIDSEEYCIIIGGQILTIKECKDLIDFLKHKFMK